jgi:integrase
LACLYPDEDRRLLACTDVPFCFRLLWGFLTREGMREGEAFALTWDCLDLKRGACRLDQNKTDDPRAWVLDPGTAEALRRYRAHFRASAEPSDLVFQDRRGGLTRSLGRPSCCAATCERSAWPRSAPSCSNRRPSESRSACTTCAARS